MGYYEFILIVNAASILILLIMAVLLLVATRFKSENGYAAAIIVLPNVPVYIYNMSRCVGWHDTTLFFFPLSFSVNTMLMPLLWLFTLRNFNPDFRFRPLELLHFIPALLCFIITISLPVQKRMDCILHETTGRDNWIGDVNAIVIFIQMIAYFTAIFYYLHKVKHSIRSNCSDAEYLHKEWIPQLMKLFAFLFAIVMVAYVISPRTDAWLIQILNVIAMSFLVYNAIAHPTVTDIQPFPQISKHKANGSYSDSKRSDPATFSLGTSQMQENCEKIINYLKQSQAYRRNDLSLAILSKETGIPQKVLSRSINSYLKQNFFELINEMRIEEVKRCLLSPETSAYKIDSIYEECGFRSRSTFFLAFKKVEGMTPAQWLQTVDPSGKI